MTEGHAAIQARLAGRLPRRALFVGPASVGKWSLVESLWRKQGLLPADVLGLRFLTMDIVRVAAVVALRAPIEDHRLIFARIDQATPAMLNVLLKALEEAPDSTSIILLSETMPPETITSRVEVFRFSLLSTEEVERVLIRRKFKPTEAARWAALSGGQVQTALDLSEGLDAKVTVLSVVRVIRERDATALDSMAGKWTDAHTALLQRLCNEAITKRWKVFDPAEVEGIDPRLPLQILFALQPRIRPRLVVRAALMGVLKGTS